MAQTQQRCTVRNESYLAASWTTESCSSQAVKQRIRSAISIRNQIENHERRHAIRVNVVGQERELEQDRKKRVRGVKAEVAAETTTNAGKAIAIPGTTASTEEATNATEGTASVAKVGVAAKTTNADRPNGTTTCTEMGDAQLTRTTTEITRGTMYGGTVKSFQKGMPR